MSERSNPFYKYGKPRMEYSLTEHGKELWPILHRLTHWANGEEFEGDDNAQ